MPLPKSYFQEKKYRDDDKRSRSMHTRNIQGPDHSKTLNQEDDNFGNVFDFLGQTALGALSSLTFGASEYFEGGQQQKRLRELRGEDDQTRMGKAGRILGEVGGLFVPGAGPFALIGKGTRGVAAIGKHSTRSIIKQGSTDVSKLAFETVGNTKRAAQMEYNYLLESAKKIARAEGTSTEKVMRRVSSQLEKGLVKTTQDKMNMKWLHGLKGADDVKRKSLMALHENVEKAMVKAFNKAGMRNAPPEQIKKLAGDYVKSLSEGKHLNEMSELVTHWFRGSNPGRIRDFISQYAGMAVQDTVIMGIHSLAAGKIGSWARGEEYGWNETLHDGMHSAIMGVVFPGIRLFPFGGKESVKRGWQLFRRKYEKIDYDKIKAVSGTKGLEHLVRMELKGGKMELKGLSMRRGKAYKVEGVEYKTGGQIERALDNGVISGDGMVSLMKQFRKDTMKYLNKDWRKKYLADFAKSFPRMALGGIAMNWASFRDGHFENMNPEEMWIHLMTSSLMVKSRGHWGKLKNYSKRTDAEYMGQFSDYYEALDVLGIDASSIKELVQISDTNTIYERLGGAYNTHEVGQQIYTEFERARTKGGAGSKIDYDPLTFPLASKLEGIYNLIWKAKNKDKIEGPGFDFRFLGKQGLRDLEGALKQIKFSDGLSLAELNYEGAVSRLTRETAQGTWNIMKESFKSFEDLGIGIKISENKDGSITMDNFDWVGGEFKGDSPYGANIKNNGEALAQLWSMAEWAEGEGLLRWSKSEPRTVQINPDILGKAERIIADNKLRLNTEHGVGDIPFDVTGQESENPYMKFISQGRAITAMDGVFKMMNGGRFTEGDPVEWRELSRLAIAAETLFSHHPSGEATKFLNGINEYKIEFSDKDQKLPEFQKAGQFNEDSAIIRSDNIRAQLEPLFGLLGYKRGQRHGPGVTKTIDYKSARNIVKQWQEYQMRLPRDIRDNFLQSGMDYFANRFLEMRGYDARAMSAVLELKNYWDLPMTPNGKIRMPTEKFFRNSLKTQNENWSQERITEHVRMYKAVRRAIGEQHIQAEQYAFGDYSDVRGLADYQAADIAKIHESLKSEVYHDFIRTGDSAMKTIINQYGTVGEQALWDLTKQFGKLKDNMHLEADPVARLEELRQVIVEYELMNDTSLKGDMSTSRAQKVLEKIRETSSGNYDSLLTTLDLTINEMKRIKHQYKDDVQAYSDAIFDYQSGEGIKDFNNINNLITSIVVGKQRGRQSMGARITQITTGTKINRPGFGRAESEDYMNALIRELETELTYKWNKDVTFEDLIKNYNEKGGSDRLLAVSQHIHDMINLRVRKNDPIHQQFEDILQSLEGASPIHNRSETGMSIAQRYGLVDSKDPNTYHPEFVRLVLGDNLIGAYQFGLTKIEALREKNEPLANDLTERWVTDSHALFLKVTNNRTHLVGKIRNGGLELVDGPAPSKTNFEFKNRPWDPEGRANTPDGKKYDMISLDPTLTYHPGGQFGKLRKIHLGDVTGMDGRTPLTAHSWIQEQISKTFMLNKNMNDYLRSKLKAGDSLHLKEMEKLNDAALLTEDFHIYMRISHRMHEIFVATEANIDLLNADYSAMYQRTLQRYSNTNPTLADTFQRVFGNVEGLVGSTGKASNKMLELKMMLLYSEWTAKGSFDEMILKLSQGVPKETIQDHIANMFKRTKLSDGGTTNVITDSHNSLLLAHSNPVVQQMALRFNRDPNSLGMVSVRDEEFGGLTDPFHAKGDAIRQIDVKLTNTQLSPKERAVLEQNKRDLEENKIESLNEASTINGGVPVSYELMSYLMASQGKDADVVNGMKPIGFQVGDGNNLLLKGFMYYNPDVIFPEGSHMVVPESVSKSIAGLSLSGRPIAGLSLRGVFESSEWMNRIVEAGPDNIMNIRMDNIGLSFTGKTVGGVTITNSMARLENSLYVKEMELWQGMKTTIDNLKIASDEKGRANRDLAQWLFQTKQDSGFTYDQGSLGLARIMVENRVNIQNPTVRFTVDKMLRSKAFENIRKPFSTHGEDTFIIPNGAGDLSNSAYTTVRSQKLLDKINTKRTDPKNPQADYGIDEFNLITDRLTSQYGEIGVSNHLMTELQFRGLDDLTFVYRDDGIDVLAKYSGGFEKEPVTFETYSKLYKDYSDHYIVQDKGFTGADAIRVGKQNKDNIKNTQTVLRIISDYSIENGGISGLDIHRLLKGEKVNGENLSEIIMRKGLGKPKIQMLSTRWQELNLAIASSGIAVPLKGGDKAIHRIGKVNDKIMNGLVEINNYDAAVVHQRDYDGDHFYIYMDKPWTLIKSDAGISGRIQDFKQFVKPTPDINPFGFNWDSPNREVGERQLTSVGYEEMAQTVHRNQKGIGPIVGNNDALTLLMNWGFKSRRHGGMFDLTNIKNFEVHREEFRIFERLMHANQSGLDIYPHLSEALQGENAFRLTIEGHSPKGIKDPLLSSLSDKHIFKRDFEQLKADKKVDANEVHWADTPSGVRSIKVLLRTLKKSNALNNEIYDEAGSKTPEPGEIADIIGDIRSLVNNPNRFLFNKVRDDIMRDPTMKRDEKTSSMEELVGFFYGFTKNKKEYAQKLNEFMDDVWSKKRLPGPNKIFTFNKELSKLEQGSKRFEKAIEYHLGLKALSSVNDKQLYSESVTGDFNHIAYPKLLESAGYTVNGMLERIGFIKAFGQDIYERDAKGNLKIKIDDPILDFTDKDGAKPNVARAIHRGVLHAVLKKEYSGLNNRIRFLSEERFTNPLKITKLRDRIDRIEEAINLLEEQYYKGMVADQKNVTIISPTQYQPGERVRYSKRFDKPIFVYAIKKDMLTKNKKTGKWEVDIKGIDHETSGWYGGKGNPTSYAKNPGFYFVHTKNPPVHETVNTIDAKYAYGLRQVTRNVGDIDAIFAGDYRFKLNFISEAQDLKSSISDNFTDNVRLRKITRIDASERFMWSDALEVDLIRKFLDGSKTKDGWVKRIMDTRGLEEVDARKFILHYLVNPRALGGHFQQLTHGKDAVDLPYYKINQRLLNALLKYYATEGQAWGKVSDGELIVKEFVDNWERSADGTPLDVKRYVDRTHALYGDKYNFNLVSKDNQFMRSLVGSVGIEQPLIDITLSNQGAEYMKMSAIKTGSGDGQINIKRPIEDAPGKPKCVF